jgi:hypothetical protein
MTQSFVGSVINNKLFNTTATLLERTALYQQKCYRPIRHTRESGYPVELLRPIDILDSRFHGNDEKKSL